MDLNNFDVFRDNGDLVYAAKHRIESGLRLTGNVHVRHTRGNEVLWDAWEPTHNTFCTEGMAALLNIMFFTTSKAGAAIFYVGIFKNDVSPTTSSTAAVCLGAAGTFGECQDADYSSPATNKPSYVVTSTATAGTDNSAAPASFTIATLADFTVYGAFLSTATAKTATSGYMIAAKKFGTARAVIAADVLAVTYAIALTTS
jgi:hypothetical protein